MENQTPLTVPSPVSIAGLKEHFKTTYQLREDQVELMVQSSRKSMEKILDDAVNVLQSDDVFLGMANLGHNLKGLLLNMGEQQWADVARDLERSAKAREARDYAAVITSIHAGMAAVIGYGDDE